MDILIISEILNEKLQTDWQLMLSTEFKEISSQN